jgi:uncharacterized peroxidase-related enzyme
MKLARIERGTDVAAKIKMAVVAVLMRERVPDIARMLMYRPEFFGKPLTAYIQALLRGASEWTIGERELFASFVSHCNDCAYCHAAHRAVAVRALGTDLVDAVFRDWRSAPVTPQLRAVLEFLELMTLGNPIERHDVERVLDSGVTDAGLQTAVHICIVFTVINRVADALGFEVESASSLAKSAEHLLRMGYRTY